MLGDRARIVLRGSARIVVRVRVRVLLKDGVRVMVRDGARVCEWTPMTNGLSVLGATYIA